MVKHEALGADRRSLDLLAGPRLQNEIEGPRRLGLDEQGPRAVDRGGPGVVRRGSHESGHIALARFKRRQIHGLDAAGRGQVQLDDAGGGQFGIDVGPAKGPAGPERDVREQALRPARPRRDSDHVEKVFRQIGLVPHAQLGIVQRQRIDWLDFEAAEAASLHRLDLTDDLFGLDGAAKPPPAGHGSAFGWRPDEAIRQSR